MDERDELLKRMKAALKDGRANRKDEMHRIEARWYSADYDANRSSYSGCAEYEPQLRENLVKATAEVSAKGMMHPWGTPKRAIRQRLKEKRPSTRAVKKSKSRSRDSNVTP